MTALLIADHDNVKLRPATASAVTALLQMTEAVDVLVAGNGCEAVAEEAAKIAGVRTVLLAQNAKLAQELPEVLAYTAAHEAPGYSHIFFCATALGKAAMPRVAAQLDRSAVSVQSGRRCLRGPPLKTAPSQTGSPDPRSLRPQWR